MNWQWGWEAERTEAADENGGLGRKGGLEEHWVRKAGTPARATIPRGTQELGEGALCAVRGRSPGTLNVLILSCF